MRAVRDIESGGPEVLKITEIDEPSVTGDGVLIEVAAAGINRADVLQRQGNYPVPPDATDVFGLEVSGTVAELGPDVPSEAGLNVGDKVVALLDSGGYAEKVVAPWPQVLPAPVGMDLVEAAAARGRRDRVLQRVHGRSRARGGDAARTRRAGGIGTHAIQVAKALGLTVLATVGSQEKADFVTELGATAIKYKDEDFVERVKELTDGHGADVILDVMGAKYLEPNVKALANNGRITIIGMQGGVKGELNIGRLMSKRGAVIGTTLRARPLSEKAQIMGAVRQIVWPHVNSGAVRPIMDKTFPLEQVRDAHEYFDSGSHIGKVLLTP
ncbi:NAD(P)H-quinone oxidoreductase [Kocuria atrinae]|uniref:NAD(P)H-quinone oxidoreductase n=1 Tax=Kocuria atrinae TaxID=592377 RepID=UPI00030DFD47|nr:NAD(P)H-quinone oxidoreductase [Kocuria atrinae]